MLTSSNLAEIVSAKTEGYDKNDEFCPEFSLLLVAIRISLPSGGVTHLGC